VGGRVRGAVTGAVRRPGSNAARDAGQHAPVSGWRQRWPRTWWWIKKVAPWLLAALVLTLVARQASDIDWASAWQALQDQPLPGLAAALGLSLSSHVLVASYDLIGRYETSHDVPIHRTLRIAAVSYAFNLNFGSLVGAIATKLRLYGRAGLSPETAGRIILLSVMTNWLGYFIVGGAVMALAPPTLSPDWPVSETALRWLGAAMLLTALAHVGWRWHAGRSHWQVRGHDIPLPGGRVVLWQAVVSAVNWAAMGLIVWILLQGKADYAMVLGVLLLAAVAGVVTHVPAGLGVIEAVFIVSLGGGDISNAQLLAALLAYRAVYYLLPLVPALVAYAYTEAKGKTTS